MRPISLVSSVVFLLILATATFAQTLVQPAVFVRTVSPNYVGPGGQPAEQGSQQLLFSSGDITLPLYSNSQFGASSRVYTLNIYGLPKCTQDSGQEVCISQYWFKLSVDANVVSAVTGEVSAIREYIFSQKGSPLAVSLPVHTWTTKKGDVKQSWFAFSPTGSARFIPVTGANNKLSGGGAFSLGAIAEANIEFEATDPGNSPSGSGTTYPGTLYFSVTPTIAATVGGPLKATIFQNSSPASWVWGGEYRAGFQFRGEKPISIAITGTFSRKGLTSSTNGVAFSLSKLFGGSR